MRLKRRNITQKLTSTYLTIIVAAIISGLFCLYTIFRYQDVDKEMMNENIPSIEAIKQLQVISKETNKLIKNWVYLSNQNDKDLASQIIKNEFKEKSKKLEDLLPEITDKTSRSDIQTILFKNKKIIENFSKLENILSSIDAFFDEKTVDKAVNLYENNINNDFTQNDSKYGQLLKIKLERQKAIFIEKEDLINYLMIIVFIAVIAILLISLTSIFYTKKNISVPLIHLKEIISNVSLGEIEEIQFNYHSDEIADMQNALNGMIYSLKEKVVFANAIGQADYTKKIHLLSEKDQLGKSLMEMSSNLQASEQKIKVANQSLNSAQSIAKLGNWSYNFEKNEVFWSKEMFNIFEIQETQNIQELVKAYKPKIHPEDKQAIKEVYLDTIKNKNEFLYEHRLICNDGSLKYIQGLGECTRDKTTNRVIELNGVIQDITDSKIIENELKAAKVVAENLAKAKDEFMSSMSHEIRTPLNGILGFTNILLGSKNLTQEQGKQIEAIKTSGDILLVIINDILDIAKIESGKMTLENNPFNLKDLTQLIIDTFAVKINEKELNIEIDIASTTPTFVLGDTVRMSQVFFNFISNAIKFTSSKGTIKIQIKPISEDEQTTTLQISVSDTGIGIPAEKLSSVFEPFVQTSDDTARKFGGTGLGLTIVKKIVELMNGEVSVESELNVGTTFKIIVPFKKIKQDLKSESINISEDNNSKEQENIPTKNYKILLAEDNLINQLLAQTVLAQFNYDVTTVENGLLAFEAVKNEHFDLVLMDLMMPEMDGYEAAIQIRKLEDQQKKSIPIIALTADVTNSVITKCKEIGMNDYMSKPFDSNELSKKINELVIN